MLPSPFIAEEKHHDISQTILFPFLKTHPFIVSCCGFAPQVIIQSSAKVSERSCVEMERLFKSR